MMGVHRWLLGPLLCLIVGAVEGARPPECQPPPLWSVGHRQPLVMARGKVTVVALLQASCPFCLKQASSLESLRNHFSSYGIGDDDLHFLIVNNHRPHSLNEKSKLKARVSFPVYQDTEQSAIWQRMQGGKDDLFIYDRCGRLAYFIPFPLSIMGNEKDAIVPSAILSTYFQSPCGPSCETPLPDLQEDTNNQTTLESDFSTPLYPELFNNSSSEQTLFNETSNSTDFPFFNSLEEEDEDDFNATDHHHNEGAFITIHLASFECNGGGATS